VNDSKNKVLNLTQDNKRKEEKLKLFEKEAIKAKNQLKNLDKIKKEHQVTTIINSKLNRKSKINLKLRSRTRLII